MLSKNNRKEQLLKQEPKKQRFTIKKLTIGVASVLIGFTFMGMNASADATTDTHSNTANQEAIQTNIDSGSKTLNNEQTNSFNSVANGSTNNTVSNDANNQNLVTSQGIDQNKIVQNTTTEPTQNSQVQSVSDYSQFLNALQSDNVSTIKLNQNIDFSNANLNNGNYQDINNYGIARTITIDGQNQYALNMGNNYIDLDSNTYYEPNASNPTRNWNVILKDLNLQTTSGYGPFWFNSATSNDSTLTFNGVTTSKDSGQLLNNSTASSYPNVNVNFEGQNKLQGSLNNSNITSSALIQANNVNFSNGSTVFTVNNNSSSDLADIEASGNVVVDGSAQVDFNSEATSNMAGISFAEGGAGNQTIDNATSGVLRLMPNAQVTMELGSGASMGVNNASNLDLQDNSSLKITTSKMNSTGFRSAGLVGLDYDGDTNDSTVRISPNAVLSVIRTNVTNSDAPLLAMGPNSGNGEIYHLEVNSGSLNLQDSAYSSFLPSSYTLSKSQYSGGWPAILTMWGTSSQNYLNFNNAKLINLQRTAPNKPGYLIKTEGAGDYAYHQTHIVINSPDSAYNTPLTIIPAGETKPVTWNVKYLNNTSQGGDYAYAFRSYRDFGDWNNVGSEYMNGSVNDNTPAKGVNEVILTPSASDPGSNSFSNGAVVPEGSETKASKALNNFINHFSWWNASGVKFGSSLDENNQYTPSYKPVTVEQGQSATDDPTFTNQDGKDVTAPTGTTFTTGTDTPGWATIDPSKGTVTVNPGTDVTPGAYNVPVIVTYSDKSTDDTTVPVIVTKAGQTVTWGDNGAIVTTVDVSKLNAHETTKNSQVLSAAGVVSAEGYKLTDGKLSTTATPITIDPSTVSWTTTPDTNVETATASGKDITTSIKVDFANNDAAKNILGSKNDMVTTNPFTIDAKGAGAKNVTTPVNVALGSDLTSEQFNQLVDNNIPTDEIASTTWATKPDEQGQGGVIRITFTDKAANGQPTYLNVNIPASSIKVTTDADKYAPKGQTIIIKQGEIPSAPDGIGNKDQLPKSTTYTWQTTPNTNESGKKTAVVVVTYPDGSKANVTTNIIVDANPEVKPITTTVNGNPAATEGIANLDNGGTTPVDGYPTSATWTTKPDTSKPGATTGTATVTYPDGTTETVTIPVAVNGGGDVVIINNGHVFSLHANNVVTHKTSDKNIIGEPVIENFKLSYYEGGQNYSKPYIYTLNGTGTEYILTQPGDNPTGVTVNAPQSINASEIKINWTAAGTPLFSNALGEIKGNGQPSSLVSDHDNNTGTQIYTGSQNDQYGYPMYSATVDSSSVNWPIYGKGPVSTYPFPSVYIYGAEANGTIPSVNSDTTDLKVALGDGSKLVNTSDLTAAHNAEISSVAWQKLPSLEEANAKAPATVRINFIDGSYLDVPVAVNVIKVDQGVDNKTNSEIYRDITRTINVEGESTPVVQHVIYSRAKVTNLSKPAGQQVTYTDWVAAKNSEGQAVTIFSQFNVTKPGYTAAAVGATIQTNDGQQYVPASATITPDSQNEVVDVTYTANEHTLVINYVDGNGTVIGTYKVPGKTGEKVNVNVPGNVPTNWQLVPNQQIFGSYTFGSNNPQPVDYKVEHKTEVVPVDKNNKNTYRTITQTIQKVLVGQNKAKTVRSIIVPFQRTGIKDLVTGDITWNAWQGPEGSVDKDGQSTYMIPVYTITPQKGYDTYVNGEKNTANQIPAVDVTATSKNITDTITYVREGSTPVPYDPSNKDMNMSVTRIINYEVPTGHATITPVTQTIEYIRDNDGVAGYRDPVTGDITWNPWHVKNGDDQFPSTSIIQIAGYDSYVDGIKTTEVPAASVVEKDGTPQNGKTVTVSYQKQGTTQTDADNYTPEGQDVNTKTGVVPDPADGIKNKSDLPEGTKYTWKNAPDVTTAGDKTGTVIVTYPDGSKDEVPVTIRVINPTTDADKYTADGGNITVDKGHVLTPTDAENAIVNHSDLPEGTTYTWKYAPDTNTVGNKNGVVTVTYPDGSVDEVPVMVHVVDDADKYDPQGQTITIKKGDPVPSAEQGIKNASELPSGTKYTWDVAPDPAKVGSQPVIITINYPDGSQDQVPTTVIVTDTTTPRETDADKYNPKGQVVNVDRGAKLPEASEGIANKDTLPDGTKYTWKTAPDTSTTGDKPAVITVTYPDGSNEDVPTIVHVNSTDADKYTPQGQTITVDKGAKVPGAATAITNKRELPADTKYTWETTPDTNKVGVQPAVVIVTYPDGSQDNVPVIITVKNPETQPGTTTDVDKYTPEGGTIVTTIGADLTNDAPEGIVNKDALPAGTKYSWTNGTPSTSQAGLTMHYVTVTYPDGSSEVVPVYVNVTSDADKYSPEPQTVTVEKGETPNPADGIKNRGDLPGGTKYTWKTTPDTTTSGNKPAVIVVTYPDGSKDKVPTVVHVTNPATDADKYTPETQPITTPEGKVPDASDGIKNKADLPNGTKYTWTNPDQVAQDVKKSGSHTETITITYPDGSRDTVTVTVNVPTPEGQDITTNQGKLPNPADAIKNKDQMPAGTTYTWKQEPDVSTPGDHTGVVEVRFPDGTTSEVTVIVHVDAVTPDNGGNISSGNGSIDHQNGTEINNGNMTNANNGSVIENVTENSAINSTSQQPAKTLPQTGNDSSEFSALAGLSLAAVASLFGFADHDKKRKADK